MSSMRTLYIATLLISKPKLHQCLWALKLDFKGKSGAWKGIFQEWVFYKKVLIALVLIASLP